MYELIKLISIDSYIETCEIFRKQQQSKKKLIKSSLYYSSKNTMRIIGELYINIVGYSNFLTSKINPKHFIPYDQLKDCYLPDSNITEENGMISVEEFHALGKYKNACDEVLFSGWSVISDTKYLLKIRNFKENIEATYVKYGSTFVIECTSTGNHVEIKEVRDLLKLDGKEYEFTENFNKLFNNKIAK